MRAPCRSGDRRHDQWETSNWEANDRAGDRFRRPTRELVGRRAGRIGVIEAWRSVARRRPAVRLTPRQAMGTTALESAVANAWRVGILLGALYLLTFGGGPHAVDEIAEIGVAASIVRRGALDTNELYWTIAAAGNPADAQVAVGPTGDTWSKKGIVPSLLMLPSYALAFARADVDLVLAALLAMVPVTAATGAGLVLLARRHGIGQVGAVATGLAYGTSTLAWPYSRLGFGEPAIALAVVVAALAAPRGLFGAAGAGLALAVATGAKPSALALALPFAVYVAWTAATRTRVAAREPGATGWRVRWGAPSRSTLLNPLSEGSAGEGVSAYPAPPEANRARAHPVLAEDEDVPANPTLVEAGGASADPPLVKGEAALAHPALAEDGSAAEWSRGAGAARPAPSEGGRASSRRHGDAGKEWQSEVRRAARASRAEAVPDIARALGAFGVGLALGLAALAAYNLARFGSPLATGYALGGGEDFSASPVVGLLGLTIGPYRGLLWFAPVSALAVALVPLAWRRAPALVGLAGAVGMTTLVTYAAWWTWWGGYTWGPRFLLPALPLLTLALPLAWPRLSAAARWGTALIVALSALAQVPGVLVDFNPTERALREHWPTFPDAAAAWELAGAPIALHMVRLWREGPVALDVVWWRNGQLDRPLLASLILALALAAAALIVALARPGGRPHVRRRGLDAAALGALALALVTTLQRASVPPSGAMADLLAAASARDRLAAPGDATVLLASPEVPALWRWSRARQPVYGVNRDDLPGRADARALLGAALARHPRLWLLAANVARDDPANGVERWLRREAFMVDERGLGAARQALFLTPGSPLADDGDVTARFGRGETELGPTRIDGAPGPGEPIRVTAIWRGRDADWRDLSVFVHVYRADRLIAQVDRPLRDALPDDSDPSHVEGRATGRYAPRLPGDVAPGTPITLAIGLYRPNGQRLSATGRDGAPWPDDRVPLGELAIR